MYPSVSSNMASLKISEPHGGFVSSAMCDFRVCLLLKPPLGIYHDISTIPSFTQKRLGELMTSSCRTSEHRDQRWFADHGHGLENVQYVGLAMNQHPKRVMKNHPGMCFFGDSAIFLIAWKSSLVPFGDVRRRSQDCVYDSEVNLLRVDEPVLSIVIIFNRAPAF